MDFETARLSAKWIILMIFAAGLLVIILMAKFGPKDTRPLAYRFGKTSAPKRPALGTEAINYDEVSYALRENSILTARNEGKSSHMFMPRGYVPAISLSDADYAKRYQKAFGRQPKGSSND